MMRSYHNSAHIIRVPFHLIHYQRHVIDTTQNLPAMFATRGEIHITPSQIRDVRRHSFPQISLQ